MKQLILLMGIIVLMMASCSEKIDNTGTCTDGVRNQGEQSVDCGGPCPASCPSCADGIRNQDEVAVDCGGSCDPCYARLSASINGMNWTSTSRNAFISGPGTIRFYGTNQSSNITLYYSGPFRAGTIPAGTQFRGEFRDLQGNVFLSNTNGSITFYEFDTTAKSVSGIFAFMATDTISGTSKAVTGGVFNVLTY